MSLLRRDSASQSKQIRNRIYMIKRDLHGINENINVRKSHVNKESLENDERERIQTEINMLEERKAKLETEKAGLQKQLKGIE